MTDASKVVDDILEHHGVKGMHWGVRKSDSTSNPYGKNRYRRKNKLWRQVEATMVKEHLPRINAKPEYVKALANGDLTPSRLKNDPSMMAKNNTVGRKYHEEVSNAYIKEYEKAFSSTRLGKKGTHTIIKSKMDYLGFSIVEKPVKHADSSEIRVTFVKSPDGAIVGFDVSDNTLTQNDDSDYILEHYGVKGMKWGVKRERPHEVTLKDLKRGVKTSGGYRHPVHTDAVVARTIGQKSRGSGVKALSNEELRIYANRLQLEQNVKRLDFNDRHPAKRFVLNVLGQSGRDAVNREANLATKKLGRKAIKLAMATA